MAEYKSFGATNEPRTCLWCGVRLAQYMSYQGGTYVKGSEITASECCNAPIDRTGSYPECSKCFESVRTERRGRFKHVPTGTYGWDGKGYFCRQMCATQFGTRMAELGKILVPLERR